MHPHAPPQVSACRKRASCAFMHLTLQTRCCHTPSVVPRAKLL